MSSISADACPVKQGGIRGPALFPVLRHLSLIGWNTLNLGMHKQRCRLASLQTLHMETADMDPMVWDKAEVRA